MSFWEQCFIYFHIKILCIRRYLEHLARGNYPNRPLPGRILKLTFSGQNMGPVSKTNPADKHPPSELILTKAGERWRKKQENNRQSKAVILICPTPEISGAHCFNCFKRGERNARSLMGDALPKSPKFNSFKNLSPDTPFLSLIPVNPG